MKRENLVFLVYAFNTCYVQLLEEQPKDCEIDLEKGFWEFDKVCLMIGTEMRHCRWGSRWGVIGIYDRSNFKHLKNLLSHAREAVRGPSTARPDDD